MSPLDQEERAILDAFEAGQLHSVAHLQTELEQHRQYAVASQLKNAQINIWLPTKDLEILQKQALTEGVPYQTMIASLLHKYAQGRLVEQS